MALRRRPRPPVAKTLTLDQELAYEICSAFYRGEGCACAKGDHGSVCSTVEDAARRAKAIVLAAHHQ